MFPRLDVDFHLAPFVDSRDHVGVAAARVRIGAPHFEREREFWVRAVRWYRVSERANLLLRPVDAEDSRLLLATFAFKIDSAAEDLNFPIDWQEAAHNRKKLFSSLARFWHEPQQNIRIGWKAAENPTLYLPDEQKLRGEWQLFPFNEARHFSADAFVDLPTKDFHDFLQQRARDTQSQLHLSWQWHSLTLEQQWSRFFAGPIWKHYPKLLQNIMQSEAFFTPKIATGGVEVDFSFAYAPMRVKGVGYMPVPGRSRRWERVLYEYFGAQKAESYVPAHIDFQDVKLLRPNSEKYESPRNVLNVKCPAPTHHEMLEARLQLHEWARAHLPPSRARELIALDDLGEFIRLSHLN